MRFTYPVRPEEQPDGSFVMHVRDFGGATQGATRIEAYRAAEDYIATWMEMKIELGQDIPEPAACAVGEMLIEAPIDVAVVGLLHQGMLERGVSKSELARLMGIDEKQVRRMLDPKHGTKLATFRDAY